MRGVPNGFFFTGGYMAVFFTFLIGKVVSFGSSTFCQHQTALVSMHLIGGRDRHLSRVQLMTLRPMTPQEVPPLLALSNAVLGTQWD